MSTMLEELREKRDEALERMDEAARRIQSLPDDAPEEERDVLTRLFDRENDSVNRLTDDIRKREIIEKARADLAPQTDDDPDPAGAKRTSVKEPLIYEKRSPHSFFHDLRAAHKGETDAQQRLAAHARQMRVELERRDISNTAGAGGEFVPPLYLQDEWIPLLRAARPTADILTNRALPPGVGSIVLPRLTGGGAVAIHTENAAVNEVDPTTNNVTATVREIAGQIDISRMLMERSQPGLDEVLFTDLARDYATKLDVQVISGSGSAGQALGLRNVSGVNTIAAGTTATAAALWPKIASGLASITAAYMNTTHVIMHPRRVAFWAAALDGSNRPFFNAVGPYNAMGTVDQGVANGFAGMIQGLRVVSDPSIPTNVGTNTNEDVMIVVDASQIILYEEGAPRTRVYEDVGSGTLTVRLSVWGYFALHSARYPAAISIISGTALVPPTF